MPKAKSKAQYAELESVEVKGGTNYKVLLKTEDGYQEEQTYFVAEGEDKADVLSAAANHLNDEWAAKKEKEEAKAEEAAEPATPEFINAK